MIGDASRFFSVRMPIVLTLFAAVLLSGVMVPSIAFGEETGVGHEAGAVDGGTQASTEAHGAADKDEDDSGSGNPHDPDAPSDEGAGSGGSLLRLHMSLGGTLSMATAILPTSKESSRAGG